MSVADSDTLYGALARAAVEWPDREAVVFEAQRLSYHDLKSAVDRTAGALLASGVMPGERVAMLATTRIEYWIHFLATVSIGAIWVGLGIRNTFEELRHVVVDSEPVMLFGIDTFEGRDYRPDLEGLLSAQPSLRELVILGDPRAVGVGYARWLERSPGLVADVETAAALVGAMDPALIVYTSGTTGTPKGAVLSHHGLVTGNRAQAGRYNGLVPREICSLPINHIACVGDTCVANMLAGGTVILTERFIPREQLALIEREGVNIWGGIPAMVQMVLADPEFGNFDLSSVELTGWGGAAMPRETIERMSVFSSNIGVVYGLTETTTNVCWSDLGADTDTLAGTIGRAVAAFPCRIARDDGSVCADDEPGEIQFRASTNMLGYWRMPEATAQAFTGDGWLRTGDLGVRRSDGYILLVGRRIEAFKSGGFNVYPREVETALECHPSVRFAAVVPVPHQLYGEVGHAFVATGDPSLSEEALRTFARERLANFKVPHTIEIVEALPMLANGKIDKTGLRARARACSEDAASS